MLILAVSLLRAQAGDTAGGIAGYWAGNIMREGRAWRTAAFIGASDTGAWALVDLPDAAAFGVRFAASRSGPHIHFERLQPNGSTIAYDGEIRGDTIAGAWSGLGVTATFQLIRSAEAPPLLREEDLTFTNGAARLSGTLLLPPGRGPFPAVVIIHGSEPDLRRLYVSVGTFYARNGVAALIYDKRGVGRSTGDLRGASLDDLADDALAGVRALASRTDIDPHRIGVDGFSQGGWVAPLAATRSSAVAFVVVGSASGINPMEQSLFDRSNALRADGFSEEAIERASDLRRRWYDLLMGLGSRRRLEHDLRAAHAERWFAASMLPYPLPRERPPEGALRLLFFEPIPMWARVRVPVFAYWGEEDASVPAALSRAVVEQASALGGNRRVAVRTFAGAGHSMVMNPSGDGAWDFPRVPPGYPQAKIDWLRSTAIIP